MEFLNSSLIRGDGGALDAHFAVLDGLGRFKGDPVVSLVPVLNSEVKVLNVEIKEGMDELVLDVLPEDSGHLVTVQLSDGVLDLDFLVGEAVGQAGLCCSCNTL